LVEKLENLKIHHLIQYIVFKHEFCSKIFMPLDDQSV